eukprot:1161370-Pelagomonas_calceolata.AAC.7
MKDKTGKSREKSRTDCTEYCFQLVEPPGGLCLTFAPNKRVNAVLIELLGWLFSSSSTQARMRMHEQGFCSGQQEAERAQKKLSNASIDKFTWTCAVHGTSQACCH